MAKPTLVDRKQNFKVLTYFLNKYDVTQQETEVTQPDGSSIVIAENRETSYTLSVKESGLVPRQKGLFIENPSVNDFIAEILDIKFYSLHPTTEPTLKRYEILAKQTGLYCCPPSLSVDRMPVIFRANAPTPEMMDNPSSFGKPWVYGVFASHCGIIAIKTQHIHNPLNVEGPMEVFVLYPLHGQPKSIGPTDTVLKVLKRKSCNTTNTSPMVVASLGNASVASSKRKRQATLHDAAPVPYTYRNHPGMEVINRFKGYISTITVKRSAKQWWNKIVDINGQTSKSVWAGTGKHITTKSIVVFVVVSSEQINIISKGAVTTLNLQSAPVSDDFIVIPQYFKNIRQKLSVVEFRSMITDLCDKTKFDHKELSIGDHVAIQREKEGI